MEQAGIALFWAAIFMVAFLMPFVLFDSDRADESRVRRK